jgi:prepilin-type N-terminal cleavage/methylation domain-containing protein
MKNILANKLKKKGGFTYAELLVAVIVLTILLLISFIVLK